MRQADENGEWLSLQLIVVDAKQRYGHPIGVGNVGLWIGDEVRYGSLLEKSAVSCLLGFEQGATRGELLSLHMELLLGHLQLLQSERKVLEPPSSFEGRRRELVVAYVAPEAGTRRAHAAPSIVDRGVRQNLTLVHRAGPLAGKHASFLSGSCEAAYCWQYPLPMLQGSCGTQDRSDRCLVCAV